MPGISTVALHADRDVHPTRAVAPPIYQTATFWAEDAEQFAQAAVSRRGQDFYTRYGNPNHAQVCGRRRRTRAHRGGDGHRVRDGRAHHRRAGPGDRPATT